MIRALYRSLAVLLALFGMVASAQAATGAAPACVLPQSLPRPTPELPSAEQPARPLPVASYTLAIIWGPEACYHDAARKPGDMSCSGDWNRSHFTLHGLWPDGAEAGKWPQYCHPVDLLTDAQLRPGLCATPSVQLLQHEWAKHGSCTGETPAAYLAAEDKLFASLHYPAMVALARRRDLKAGDVSAAFAAANPGMHAEGVRLNVNKQGWLEEVWFCLDRDRRFTACAVGQGGGAAPDTPVKIAAPR